MNGDGRTDLVGMGWGGDATGEYIAAVFMYQRSKEGQRQGRPMLPTPLHAHGLIAEVLSTKHWRVTDCRSEVMDTTMQLREHHFPNVYAAVVH